MKRILAILCAMACLFALALPAMAAETITVTAQVPADWEIANVYVWNAQGNGGEWPGTAMTKGADGRYTAEIPSGFTNIIINNKQGDQGIQTKDLLMNGDADVWVVFDGTNASTHDSDPGLNATPGTSTPTTGDLNALYIVGTGIPGVGEWNTTDANGKMTANGNIYTITLGMNAGTAIKFKFCGNGSWDSGYNFGGNGEGVIAAAGTPVELSDNGQDISFTASQDCNATFTFDLSTKTLTITEEAGTPIIPEPTPGGNEGGNQGGNTGNLSGLEFLCIVGEGLDSLSWDPAAETGKMEGKDGVYTMELDLGEGSTIKFKFCGNGGWDKGFDFGGASADPIVNGTAASLAAGGQDMFYTGAGKITVTADLKANTVTITGGSEIKEDPKDETTEPTTTPDAPKKEEKKDNTTLFIILGIVGVIAAGTAVAVVIILKKK